MSSNQAHELQRLPTPSRPTAASLSRAQSTLNRNTVVTYTGFYTSQSPQFHPGLLSRGPPEPTPSFLHKLNSVYTAIGLALTLVLTFITYRLSVLSWQMSRWTAQKDFHELCLELKQASLPLSKECHTALAEGLTLPPTFMSKRWLDGIKSTMTGYRFPGMTDYRAIRNASATAPADEPDFSFAKLLNITEKFVTFDKCNASCGSWMLSDSSPNRRQRPSNFVIGIIMLLCFAILYRKLIKYSSVTRANRIIDIRAGEARLFTIEDRAIRLTQKPGVIEVLGLLVGINSGSNQLRKRKSQ
jgi:hypothetical protein